MSGRESVTIPSESLLDPSYEQGNSNQPEERGSRAEPSDGENSPKARAPTEITTRDSELQTSSSPVDSYPDFPSLFPVELPVTRVGRRVKPPKKFDDFTL